MSNNDNDRPEIHVSTRKQFLSDDQINLVSDIQSYIVHRCQASKVSPSYMVCIIAYVTGVLCNRVALGLTVFTEQEGASLPDGGFSEYLRALVHQNVDAAIQQDVPLNDETRKIIELMGKFFKGMTSFEHEIADEDKTNVKH